MPVTTREISKYSVNIISDAEPNNLVATVWLFDASGNFIAFLGFYSPGSPLPPNKFRTDLGGAVVSYPSTALASMVDVLRNEKPLYFIWYDYMPVRCFGAVGTSREPIGEAEVT